MDRSDVITLIKRTRAQDEYGVWRDNVETQRDVFCQVESITRAEFYAGGQINMKPEYMFRVFYADYDGETIVQYKGVVYSVYRTHHTRSDDLELYVQREVGVHGT